jgi:hypothetical protein
MYDTEGPQLPQEVKMVSYDTKLKPELIIKNDQVSLQDSVQGKYFFRVLIYIYKK